MKDEQIIIADCLPGFQHPPGHSELCVPINPPQDIPTLDTWAFVVLFAVICLVAWRKHG